MSTITSMLSTTLLEPTSRVIINTNFSNLNADKVESSVLTGSYAPLTSPVFTGVPVAPTATSGDNTTQIATTAFVQQETGYSLSINSSPTNLIDATTYYFGGAALSTSFNGHRIMVPRTGVITAVYAVVGVAGVLGSSEDSQFYLRLNDTTDTTITLVAKTTATSQAYNLTNQSIAVTAGDFLTGKFVAATFATNPTTVAFSIGVFIQ